MTKMQKKADDVAELQDLLSKCVLTNDTSELTALVTRCLLPEGETTTDQHVCGGQAIQLDGKDKVSVPIPSMFQQCKMGVLDVFTTPESRQGALLQAWRTTNDRSRMSDELYSRIWPSFQTAAMMIELCEPFFAKLIFAKRHWKPVVKAPASPGSARKYLVFDPTWTYSEEMRSAYREAIATVFQSIRITFVQDPSDGLWENVAGCTCFVPVDAITGCTDKCKCATDIYIHPCYLEFFLAPDYDDLGRNVRDIGHVELANLVVHELAHAINHVCRQGECSGSSQGEPSYSIHDEEGEIGYAVEHFIWNRPLMNSREIGLDLREYDQLATMPYQRWVSWSPDIDETIPLKFIPAPLTSLLLELDTWSRVLAGISWKERVKAAETEGHLDLVAELYKSVRFSFDGRE